MNKSVVRIFWPSVVGCLLIMLFGGILANRSLKSIDNFNSLSGSVIYLDTEHHLGNVNGDWMRYIRLIESPLFFAINTNSNAIANANKDIDNLKIGSQITIYYDDPLPYQKNSNKNINMSVQQIVANEKVIFKAGIKDKVGAFLFLGFGLAMLVLVILLKVKGKIH